MLMDFQRSSNLRDVRTSRKSDEATEKLGLDVSLQLEKQLSQTAMFFLLKRKPPLLAPAVVKCEFKSCARMLSEAVSHPTRLWRKVGILQALANVLTSL